MAKRFVVNDAILNFQANLFQHTLPLFFPPFPATTSSQHDEVKGSRVRWNRLRGKDHVVDQ